MNSVSLFLEFDKIPRTTAQQQKIAYVSGRVMKYDDKNLKRTKLMYRQLLVKYKPSEPFKNAVSLKVIYHFERPKSIKKSVKYKVTRPDLDNLVKALLDCMTKEGYWLDDNQVVELYLSKVYATEKVGIEILIIPLE